jgi:hypothetical protein
MEAKMKKLLFLLLLISPLVFSEDKLLNSPPPPPNPIEVVAEFLNLSDEQVELWLGLLDDFKANQWDLINQIEPLEKDLKEILNSESPDPASIGNIVIQIDNLRKEMKLNEETYRENFQLLLNEEQLEKYIMLKSAFKLAPLFPAFQDTHLI